jgi:membrane-associated phospholipid phosphatase
MYTMSIRYISIFLTVFLLSQSLFAQDTILVAKDTVKLIDTVPVLKESIIINENKQLSVAPPAFVSPYRTTFVKDGLVIAATVGVTLFGYQLINNKRDLTLEELNAKTIDEVPSFDRWSAGYYSESANKTSYILFNASYAYPVLVMLIDKNSRRKMGQISVMFIETIGITGAMYTMAAGLIYRSRPFVYGADVPMDLRLGKGGQRSFYGGHVAATAAASFFMARVFKDYNGKTKLQPWLWAIAATLPAVMAYERIKAGYHFLSDCVLSYGIGAATGLLIPALHRSKKLKNLTLLPQVGNGYQGLSFTYHLK